MIYYMIYNITYNIIYSMIYYKNIKIQNKHSKRKKMETKNKEVKIIAEIGCNHQGKVELAKEMIKQAKLAGADYVKTQKRDNICWLNKNPKWNEPHPNLTHSFGNSYFEHRDFLELDTKQHKELKEYADSIGIGYSSSCWDLQSAKDLISLDLDIIKVPSACNLDFEMLKELRDCYKGEIHISVGMTTEDEIKRIVEFFEEETKTYKDLVIYSCTSGYPVPFKDVALLEILKLKELSKKYNFKVGFSGHHIGINPDIASLSLGVEFIERHFTFNKNAKGTDHSASLEYDELKNLVQAKDEVLQCLNYKNQEILPIEKVQRDKLKSI